MTFLKIVFNSLATAAFTAVAAGSLSFLYAIASKPDPGAVGAGVVQAVGVGMVAGVAGVILGVVGSLLFPAYYLKYLVVSLLLVVGLVLLGWRVIARLA